MHVRRQRAVVILARSVGSFLAIHLVASTSRKMLDGTAAQSWGAQLPALAEKNPLRRNACRAKLPMHSRMIYLVSVCSLGLSTGCMYTICLVFTVFWLLSFVVMKLIGSRPHLDEV